MFMLLAYKITLYNTDRLTSSIFRDPWQVLDNAGVSSWSVRICAVFCDEVCNAMLPPAAILLTDQRTTRVAEARAINSTVHVASTEHVVRDDVSPCRTTTTRRNYRYYNLSQETVLFCRI